jgi:peflin
MSGRDSLPHFPAPEKAQKTPPAQTSPKMSYYQAPYVTPVPGTYPAGSPQGGYQQGPPTTGYGAQPGYGTGYGGRPVTPQPPPGVDPQFYSLFRAADTNGSGQLSEKELSRALVNGDWTPFDPKTIKLMVKMFDVDQYSPQNEQRIPLLLFVDAG